MPAPGRSPSTSRAVGHLDGLEGAVLRSRGNQWYAFADGGRMGCWVCGESECEPFLAGSLAGAPGAEHLRITDPHYGRTLPLVRCPSCGFVYASPLPAVDFVDLYEDLDDPDYIAGEAYRSRQMTDLMRQIRRRAPDATTLLDVGAGMGLLVRAAQEVGVAAVGVEPSRQLAEEAARRGLAVHHGVLPHPAIEGRRFDLVTAIDVIEHVTDPIGLLRSMKDALAEGGTLVLVTPDIESLAARGLRGRWWHHRVAHVGFLPRSATARAFSRVGLTEVARERQTWWFSASYLGERLAGLAGGSRAADLARRLGRRLPGVSRLQVPVNLLDSWVIYAREAR